MPDAADIKQNADAKAKVQAYLFKKKGRSLLFDPASRKSFALDATGEAAARIFLGEDKDAVIKSMPEAKDEEVTTALKELGDLHQRGFFQEHPISAESLDPNRIYRISVNVSSKCNLRCKYCFEDHTGARKPLRMSEETMRQTARFCAQLNRATKMCDAVIGGGSSDYAADIDSYVRFAQILEEEASALGAKLFLRLVISNMTQLKDERVTNFIKPLDLSLEVPGLEMTKDRRMPNCLCALLAVSIDGPPEAHNAMRVHPDGRGSYADARFGLDQAKANGWRMPHSFTVLTALYPDVSEIYFHLFSLGFGGMDVKPVRAELDKPHAIGQNLKAICAGYEKLMDRLLALSDEDLLRFLLAITINNWGGDYFGRFLLRVIQCSLLLHRCPAGRTQIGVDTDGKLYACLCLSGVEQACIGSVWEGIDEARLREITEQTHLSKLSPCNRCWARFFCGGGCMHQSYLTHGRIGPPDPSECALNQHLIELAIWMVAELRATRPQILRALPRSWDSRNGWQAAPSGNLVQWTGTGNNFSTASADLGQGNPIGIMTPESHLRRRLIGSDDDYRLEIRGGWNADHLSLLLTPQGPGIEDFWGKISGIDINFIIPREAMGQRAQTLPPLMADFRWSCTAAPTKESLVYTETPLMELEAIEAHLPGSNASLGQHGFLVRIAWADLHMPSPHMGTEFGFGLSLRDSRDGLLESHPYHEAGRIRLFRQPLFKAFSSAIRRLFRGQ